ncbi:hypothetical protein [Dyella sp. 20L07]|uniref:hypothetical protein n=1 Tax=Dyella sp. 20L07 TaxID=3384240 RepID=UPI003D273B08
MRFIEALIDAIRRSGWDDESVHESPQEIRIKVVEYNNKHKSGQIHVRMDLVKESWNKWPEEKQALGKQKLEKSIPAVLQTFAQMHGTMNSLDPGYWTP